MKYAMLIMVIFLTGCQTEFEENCAEYEPEMVTGSDVKSQIWPEIPLTVLYETGHQVQNCKAYAVMVEWLGPDGTTRTGTISKGMIEKE